MRRSTLPGCFVSPSVENVCARFVSGNKGEIAGERISRVHRFVRSTGRLRACRLRSEAGESLRLEQDTFVDVAAQVYMVNTIIP